MMSASTSLGGEILGVAGVAGSGQKRSAARPSPDWFSCESGEIDDYPPEGKQTEISGMSAVDISRLGIKLSFVPEDRLGMGLVGLHGHGGQHDAQATTSTGRGFFCATASSPRTLAERMIEELEIVTPGVDTPVRQAVGRQCAEGACRAGRSHSNPSVLIVAYPVRGLDINSSYDHLPICSTSRSRRAWPCICIGEDLDVLLELCDRIMVLCGGQVSGMVDARDGHQGTDRPDDDQLMTRGGHD